MCPDDTFAEGFRIKWVGDQLDKDDVGVTNFRLLCQTGTAQSYTQTEGEKSFLVFTDYDIFGIISTSVSFIIHIISERL